VSELAQGEVWYVRFAEPIGRRPAVILTRNSSLFTLHNVTVATVSRQHHHLDTEVELTTDDGLFEQCWVSLDNIQTVPQYLFERKLAHLGAIRMSQIFEAVRDAFEMPF